MLVESVGGVRASDGEDGIAATVGFRSIPHTPGRRSGILIRSINGGHRDKVPAANTAARPRRVKAPDDRRPPSAFRLPSRAPDSHHTERRPGLQYLSLPTSEC